MSATAAGIRAADKISQDDCLSEHVANNLKHKTYTFSTHWSGIDGVAIVVVAVCCRCCGRLLPLPLLLAICSCLPLLLFCHCCCCVVCCCCCCRLLPLSLLPFAAVAIVVVAISPCPPLLLFLCVRVGVRVFLVAFMKQIDKNMSLGLEFKFLNMTESFNYCKTFWGLSWGDAADSGKGQVFQQCQDVVWGDKEVHLAVTLTDV